MRHQAFGTGKWVFVDWMGIEPGYGTPWPGTTPPAAGRAPNEPFAGYCVPRGVELRAHTPDVEPECVIAIDQPWEAGMAAYATFLADGGRFRCWYEHGSGTGYAESTDGIHWTKPVLRLREVNGSTENNLLEIGTCGGGIFVDPTAPPAERYKLVGCHWAPTERAVTGAVSPDGVRWTPLPEWVLPRQHADTDNTCAYDAELGAYVLYTRQRDGAMQRRGINRSVSADFRHFPESEPIVVNSPLDPPDLDFYGNGYSRWPGAVNAHVMRMTVFRHTRDNVAVHLATSRDGKIWNRPMGQTPWIGGGASYPDPYPSVYACGGILATGQGEWSTYVGVGHQAHNEPAECQRGKVGILRARLREDGFMSLSSDGRGEFWTIPFILNSDAILLNVKTRYAGFVRAALLTSSGGDTGAETTDNTALAAFSLEQSIPVTGDHIDAPLAWRTGSDLRALRGRTVRLHLDLYKADLYAIRF